ncbi:MAG TPA: flavin reductase family protein [Acidimicrobiia bacterium]|nr:flavin reductase family protein [Acidimicrobiia bacterium]
MIHDQNPFAEDPADRDPVRRFRGRLTAPVTVVTSGTDTDRAGLTVASLIVMEGEPGLLEMVVGPSSDLWGMISQTGRFVVHVCRKTDRHLAEVFAGLRPNPGGVFAGVAVEASDWGPVLVDVGERAYCSQIEHEEVGHTGLIRGRVDRVDLGDLTDPLVYFRGRYHGLS